MAISPAIQTVIEAGNRLFSDRVTLLSHWQELADHFYYERADFTGPLSLGADYAAGSMSSAGAIYRRDMGNMFRPMLRPDDFFEVQSLDERLNKDNEARAWFQYATDLQRAVMYDRRAGFTRATEAGDHDYLTFGQAVLEVAARPDRRGLFYRNWHLRDVVWSEDYMGAVSEVHRSCMTTLRNVTALFPGKIPASLERDAEKDPFKKVKARHVVVPSDAYDADMPKQAGKPFLSVWVLPEHETVLEKIQRAYRGYIVPRAPTVSGSQYARSPFTSIILPDSRTQQAMTRILLEAGEKAIDPPLIAQLDVVRGDIGLGAGGLTWVDSGYDERLGEAIRPLQADYSGVPFGHQMSDRIDQVIRMGMMLDKVNIPDTSGMTAFQVRKVIEQQMRANIPMFEPVEIEYSEPLCSETFAVMRALGAFPPAEIPEVLRSTEIEYSFKSPLKDLEDSGLNQRLSEGFELIGAAAGLDESVTKIANPVAITRDMLQRLGWPEEWINDEKKVAAAVAALNERKQAEEMAATGAGVAEAAGKAAPMVKAMMDRQAA